MDGRATRRLDAMRRVQGAALDLFEQRGYEQVTVEDIAAAAEVGPATVYRNFGGKEHIVLWDEYDPMIFDAIAARLAEQPVLDAVQDALIESLEQVYAADRERILRRARLLMSHPALVAAAAVNQAAMRHGLASLLRATRSVRGALEAEVLAGALVAALVAAIEHWVREEGRLPLRQPLRRALRCLTQLGQVSPHG